MLRRLKRSLPIALVAALLMAAAPFVARSHLPRIALGDVCTAAGLARAPTGGDGGGGESPTSLTAAHCVLCLTGTLWAVLPSGRPADSVPLAAPALRPVSPIPRASTEPVRAAQPRGPPAISVARA